MRKWTVSFLMWVAALCAVASWAQDKGAGKGAPMDMQAAMQEMAKWATPSPAHKNLEKMAGKWMTVNKMWMDPSAPATETKGSVDNAMVLGGRWLKQTYSGDFMGMPFEGVGMVGYDNYKKLYVSTWIDNMSTSMMSCTGTASTDGTEFTFQGVMDEPVTGEKNKPFREVVRWTGPDSFVMEMYDTIAGKEVKVMEITHARAK